jgi:hypothetical protein
VSSKDTTPAATQASVREAVGVEATPEAEDAMLSAEEFKVLQQQLRTTASTRGQEGAFDLVSDHMLPGYLSRIRQQMG